MSLSSVLAKVALCQFLLSVMLHIFAFADGKIKSAKDANPKNNDGIIEKLDESKLFTPAKGFIWQFLPEINGAFQMPVKWHFLQATNDSQIVYYMTKENIETEGSYKTGLSVNVIRKVKEKIGKDALKYAREIVSEMIRNTDTLGTAVGQASTIYQYTCRSRIKGKEGLAMIVHNLAMANITTDTFYLITFEFPESQYEETEKIARVMLVNFVLDDEI